MPRVATCAHGLHMCKHHFINIKCTNMDSAFWRLRWLQSARKTNDFRFGRKGRVCKILKSVLNPFLVSSVGAFLLQWKLWTIYSNIQIVPAIIYHRSDIIESIDAHNPDAGRLGVHVFCIAMRLPVARVCLMWCHSKLPCSYHYRIIKSMQWNWYISGGASADGRELIAICCVTRASEQNWWCHTGSVHVR